MRHFIFFILFFLGIEVSYLASETTKQTLYDTLKKKNEDRLLFFDNNGHLNDCGRKVLDLFKSAQKHGIEGKKYKEYRKYEKEKSKDINEDDEAIFKALSQITDELTGNSKLKDYWKSHPRLYPKQSPEEILKTLLIEDDHFTCDNVLEFLPSHPDYQALQKALHYFRKLKKKLKKHEEVIPGFKRTYKKGDKDPEILQIKEYLHFYGYLTKEETEGENYDDVMFEAVKHFQQEHTCEPDGVLGPKTQRMFKLSLKDRIRIVKANLERWRWLHYPLDQRTIIVNVGSYNVQAFEDNHLVMFMKAIVGMPGRRTPLFKAPMTELTLNPVWYVPYSIAVKDKLNRIKNDPDYLSRGGFTMTDEYGSIVDASSVSMDDYSEGNFPFRLAQHPGKWNALGRIKFHIINNHAIYLHDTNQPELFKLTELAKSSGCVRLQAPNDLASWALEGNDLSDGEKLLKAINSNQTRHIPIKPAITVLFVYITTTADSDGHLIFGDDPYQYDKALIDALNNDAIKKS